jgi:RNA-directed DNA polymerase
MDGEKRMRRLPPDRQGDHDRATIDLVAPLALATDTHIKDNAGNRPRSCAVPQWDALLGDADSANLRSTPTTATMPGCRTSTTATRTTTTRTTIAGRARSADRYPSEHADFSFAELVQAYFDCRKHKRNTGSALAFEANLENNLQQLFDDLKAGTYRPGHSICFIILRPKPREVWAAEFRDRVVHHLLYNRISERIHASFIADSCACIPGRGTMYGAQRLESKARSITQGWTRNAFYLKCDVANFFVSIDKHILRQLLAERIPAGWWMRLAETLLFQDPRIGVQVQSRPERMALIPQHKSLFNQVASKGLPIGNLSSQFFANIYMNELDQFIKHQIRAKHYIRYVDDFVLLHESPQWLNAVRIQIETFLNDRLALRLNPKKTILQPVHRGIDFVGQVIKPHRRTLRRRTFNEALQRVQRMPAVDLFESGNSYFGLLRQASRSERDRARLGRALLMRGHTVNYSLTKIHRKAA